MSFQPNFPNAPTGTFAELVGNPPRGIKIEKLEGH
jgi:hypothetical protein